MSGPRPGANSHEDSRRARKHLIGAAGKPLRHNSPGKGDDGARVWLMCSIPEHDAHVPRAIQTSELFTLGRIV